MKNSSIKHKPQPNDSKDIVKTTRNYKASLFSSLFTEYPEELLEFTSVKIRPGMKVEPVTLQDTLFRDQINDLALLTGNVLLLFCEHMSTASRNMCVRLLLYAARTYERLVDMKALYKTKQVKLPYPVFIVLYNGTAEQPDKATMKLSEAFEDVSDMLGDELKSLIGNAVPLDLTVTVFNINKGHNVELIKKSQILSGYVEITDRIRRYVTQGRDLSEAVKKAVRECMSEHILEEYLKQHGSEVNNMLITEWDTNVAIEVAREEGLEDGIEQERLKIEQEKLEIVMDMLAAGEPIEKIAKYTKLPVERIESLKAELIQAAV